MRLEVKNKKKKKKDSRARDASRALVVVKKDIKKKKPPSDSCLERGRGQGCGGQKMREHTLRLAFRAREGVVLAKYEPLRLAFGAREGR